VETTTTNQEQELAAAVATAGVALPPAAAALSPPAAEQIIAHLDGICRGGVSLTGAQHASVIANIVLQAQQQSQEPRAES
jgi:hypothetical protein